jgi:hypothetical protein
MPEAADAAQPSEVEAAFAEVPAVEVPAVEVTGVEAPAEAVAPAASTPPAAAAAEPAKPTIELAMLSDPVIPADPAPAWTEARHLHGATLRFWQEQLERSMAVGQAIMLCRSPQEAVRLQIAYVQASLASGLAHAGELARLSQGIARDMLPFQPR